jgi:hypothetical protein
MTAAGASLPLAENLTSTCDCDHGRLFAGEAQYCQRCSMPVLIIAVVFLAIFLAMGVMAITAMVEEHGDHLFSWKWSDEPKTSRK